MNPRLHCRSAFGLQSLAVALLAGLLGAQGSLQVVPAGLEYDQTGASFDAVPLARPGGVRGMQVIAADAVGFATGVITEVAFRHSAFWRQGYASTQNVRIALGHTNAQPGQLPNRFAQLPSGPMTTVFQGQVAFPATTTPAIPRDWSVVLPLQQFWAFDSSQGNLVLEVETSIVSGDPRPWYGESHARTPGGAGQQLLGGGCGRMRSQPFGDLDFAPGGTVRFHFEYSSPRTFQGLSFLGVPGFGFGIDLTSFGMPGCTLETLPTVTEPLTATAGTYNSIGSVAWSIPNIPSLAGLFIDHQAMFVAPGINAAGFELSLAHRIFVGSGGAGAGIPATDMISSAAGETVGASAADARGWVVRLRHL